MNLLHYRSMVFSFLTGLILACPCAGAQYTLENEILASKHGHYHEAITIGEQIVEQTANNVVAHYYLADAYLHLGLLDKAASEYSICNKLSSDKAIKSYCEQALKTLDHNNNSNVSKDSDHSTDSALSHNVNHLQSQINRTKDTIKQKMKNELDDLNKRAQIKIKTINDDAAAQTAALPESFFVLNIEKENPDYKTAVDRINSDAQAKIAIINDELAERQKVIVQFYQKKLDTINSSLDNTVSQLNAGTGTIQMTPSGSNLYVHNYINYDGDQPAISPPIGLKAVAQPLSQPLDK